VGEVLGEVDAQHDRPGYAAERRLEVLSAHAAVAALGGFGGAVRVLDPPEVVAHLVRSLGDAAARYVEPGA